MTYDKTNDKFTFPRQAETWHIVDAQIAAKNSIRVYFQTSTVGNKSLDTVFQECFELATVQYYLSLGISSMFLDFRRGVIRDAISNQIRGYIERKESRGEL